MGWKPSKLLSLLSSCSGMHAGELWKDQMLKAATGHFEIWPTSNFPSLRGSRTHPWSYLQPPDSCSSRLCSDRLAPASQRQRADIKLLSAFVLIGLNSEQMKVIGEGEGGGARANMQTFYHQPGNKKRKSLLSGGLVSWQKMKFMHSRGQLHTFMDFLASRLKKKLYWLIWLVNSWFDI